MQTDFYGLKEDPFNVTPDPDFFYDSKTHKNALMSLFYGIRRRKGFMMLTGPVGSGKTMLSRALLPYLGDEIRFSLMIDPIVSPLSLLVTILEDLNIEVNNPTLKSCHDALNASLMQTVRNGSTTILIIDEAQHLEPQILEQIRLLSNFETNKEKLIQIVLVGQPELNALLAQPELRQLRQRIAITCTLSHLTKEETRAYISHRIRVAGGLDDILFDSISMDRIYHYSKGIPRVINILCDHVMTQAYEEQINENNRAPSVDMSSPCGMKYEYGIEQY